jgi:hypothetical protein
MKRLAFAALLLTTAATAFALEGKWTPQQVLQIDPAYLKKEGLQIAPSRLWDPQRGTGLLAATVNVGGCSGGFIAPDGLFITNHHCLFSILQEHATPQDDIITNGYVAKSRGEELTGKALRLTIPRSFTDVTKDILAAIPKDASDAERHRAIERRSNELVAECEKKPSTRCRVAAFDGGVQYILADQLELSDIRLVYAPPRSVGEYGGEIDNWMWPRHTGDFAIGRAYVNGAPYHTEFFFPIAKTGVNKGDFVMVMGYPGITYRSLTAAEMLERRDLFFTRRRDLYGEWIRILEETTKGNTAAQILVADNLKTLGNRYKNAEGQLAGFRRGAIVEKHRTADDAVLQWASTRPEFRSAVEAYRGLAAMIDEQRRTWENDFILSQLYGSNASPVPMGPKSLFLSTSIVRSALERQKPDADRDPLYMQRNLGRLADRLAREQNNFFEPADKRLLASVAARYTTLKDLDVDALYAQSKVFDPAERAKMLTESPDQLRARHDALLDLGFRLEPAIRDLEERKDRWDGMISRLRPEWRRAVMAHAGKPVAFDANSTLRVSFAHVRGYTPRDGVVYEPFTTLAGVLEKDTGEEPFNAPKELLALAAKSPDTPVDFLADADTTGGNSGSPTVNGRGELVGVNFDRVWENVANDFGYLPDAGRNINVDIRYLLFMLTNVQKAPELLKEVGR